MTSRCTAYRRSVIAELSGFVDDFIGQEDVEFVVRFLMAGKKALNVQELEYYHPPLLVGNFRKPMAVGQSFFRVRKRYPLLVWLLLLLNCSRHAPLYLIPWGRFREKGRFGLGFLFGVISGLCGKKEHAIRLVFCHGRTRLRAEALQRAGTDNGGQTLESDDSLSDFVCVCLWLNK